MKMPLKRELGIKIFQGCQLTTSASSNNVMMSMRVAAADMDAFSQRGD
jgi:hypothetical protein